jgi:hypothetical protein
MIRVKPGVRLGGIRPEVVFAVQVAEGVWKQNGSDEVTISGGIEGVHMRGSEHVSFLAVDLRTKDLGTSYDRQPARQACLELQVRLGPDYDVILEAEGKDNEHCHVEFDPKAPYGG